MAAASAQEPSEWDEDPAWSRPDPMTAAELEAGLDRVCEQDEDPCDAPRSTGIRVVRAAAGPRAHRGRAGRDPEAAADELLAVEAAAHRAAGARAARLRAGLPRRVVQPGGRVRAGDGAGRAARLRGPGGRRRRRRGGGRRRGVRRGVRGRAGRGAVRVGPGRGPRRRPQARRLGGAGPPQPRRPPDPAVAPSSPPTRSRYALGESRGRADADRPGPDPGHPAARHRRGAGRRDDLPVQGRDHRPRHRPARRAGPAPPRTRSWTGPPG